MSDWGTPVPDLSGVTEACQGLERDGFDVGEIHIVLNGQHGGWDVTVESTNEDMEDCKHVYILERYGSVESKGTDNA
jgi:hypothetical protein